MNIFGIGLPEMAVIAAIGLLVFGPKRLPELGKTLGKTLKGFQSASSQFEQEFRKAVDTVSNDTVSVAAVSPEVVSPEEVSPAAVSSAAVSKAAVSTEPLAASQVSSAGLGVTDLVTEKPATAPASPVASSASDSPAA
ncbi:MAG: TatA/E family twin arginine-targeting protein translocase [Synechococcales cyanobacterium SupBloom_Metag_052]|nr:TatA/E family twin arginine-targeting protein translocase [Synechococcales cyanobacterium SupBloom_Metag_052]